MEINLYDCWSILNFMSDSLVDLINEGKNLFFCGLWKSPFINILLYIANTTTLFILLTHCSPITNHFHQIKSGHLFYILVKFWMMSIHTFMMLYCFLDIFNHSFRITKFNTFIFTLVIPCQPNIWCILGKFIFAFVMEICPFYKFIQCKTLKFIHDGHIIFHSINMLLGPDHKKFHHFFCWFLHIISFISKTNFYIMFKKFTW